MPRLVRHTFALIVAAAALVLVTVTHSHAAEPLTEQNYEHYREKVALRPGDLNFQKVDWHSRFFDARNAAQQADKPLVVWFYFGDPRGGC